MRPDPRSQVEDSTAEAEARRALESEVALGSAETAQALLEPQPDSVVADVLGRQLPPHALRILDAFAEGRRADILALVPQARRLHWEINATYPEQSVGRMMLPPVGIFS